MEIIKKFKHNGYFTSDLYHLLAKTKVEDRQQEITPSVYEKEMKMGTAERLQCLHNIAVENIVSNDNKAVLSFTPRLILFQNFKPNQKLVAKFSVKNISQAPTYLNMVYKESSYFFVKPSSGQLLSRLAPGISVTFSVTFEPVQYEDYTHEVTFYTDTDEYVLPLIAMGPRPIFSFPDQVSLPTGPLKVEQHLMLTVHNVGLVPAGFTLVTRTPFSVQPKSTYLNPNEKINIRIGFKTMYLGESKGVLNAILETGENFRINIIGSTHLVNVEIEKQVVRFLDTYNTMVRQQTIKIVNKSNHLLTYACMKNNCVYRDFEDKIKLATVFYNVKENESAKANKLVHYDVLSSDEHQRVYTRIFNDEIQALVADESLFFKDSLFSITPISGEIWPNKSTELTIIFSPNKIGEFDATTYLDIDGVDDRIPLKMKGTSLPPSIIFNLETLDMDNVYINKTYNYEIVANNKGHINGTVVYKEMPTLFGSVISCKPLMRCIRPGEMDIFVISFCNSNQGPFFEELHFSIRNTDVVLKIYLKGTVIYPSLKFSVPCLDFEMVSVGVPKTLQLEVINESTVNVDANVKIPSDGPEINSITLQDYAAAERPKPKVPQWPKEFHIEPNRIRVTAESTVVLKVTLTANLIRTNQTSIELDFEKSDSAPIVLPVTFEAMVPDIIAAPDVTLKYCCLDCPYTQVLSLQCNKFWGYFTIDESEESTTLAVNVEVKEGFIEPNSILKLPITIKTGELGNQEHAIRLNIFGLSKPVEVCHISVTGVQPIVTCSPTVLHWGQVKLLTNIQKVLTLCNDSPITINFKTSLLNKDGRWHINPMEGRIDPEAETELIISLYLIDADVYSNKAIIQMEKVKDLIVPLSAVGIGTSIIVGEYRDKIVLGKHFTKIAMDCKITMENYGTRVHALEWSEHYKAPKAKHAVTGFFALEPKVFKMAPGEKLELSISGMSHKVAAIKETWYLVGSVEGINKKELLLECPIFAEFVDPKIELSALIVEFRYDFGPYSEYYKITELVSIKNVSSLPLDFEISARPPFAIIRKESSHKILPQDENLCGCICYNESDLNVPNIVGEHGLRSKTFIDCLTQAPVEIHKKSTLQFFEDINKIKRVFKLTNYVEERLDDQEVMKLQVLFDTTKHVTLKSKIYSDLLKIKFKGHRNKDAIRLTGKINYPNLLIITPKIDFHCVLNNSTGSKTIKIHNITPLLVCYKFKWKNYSVNIQPLVLPQKQPDTETNPPVRQHSSKTEVIGVKDILSPQTADASVLYEIEYNDFNTQYNLQNDDIILQNKVIKRIAPITSVEYNPDFQWTNKLGVVKRRDRNNINEIFQVVPHRGLLKPNEIQYVHVIFKPTYNVHINAMLECEVLGGPSELISICGHSSDLSYAVSSKEINFKIRSFHEITAEKLVLSNIALLPFHYNTYFYNPTYENDHYMALLNIIPDNMYLEAKEEVEIGIEIKPGVMGYFERNFLLEVGHLPFIPIKICGWGLIPQVYLTLPRPEISKCPPELGYRAISELTPEYLDAISEVFVTGKSEHLNSPFLEKCFEDNLFQENWYICSVWEKYPSVMDIELAMERVLIMNYINEHPDVLNIYKTSQKMIPIPGFQTTPYLIDLGVVITGNTVQTTVNIINYGPIVTKLNFAKGTSIPAWLKLKLCGKLCPGESGKLEITFSPNSNDFGELEQHIETSFNLEVPYGVAIPVKMKALCAVPYLCSNVKAIDFGSVRCGDKIIYSIPLKNVGKPACIWYASLKVRTHGPNPMTILSTSGRYESEEGGWLSIAFKPTIEMAYEALLTFKFHMNPNRLTIPVFGKGLVPQVHVIGSRVAFPPTLPYADTTYIYFGLTNPCPFPIELIFAHNDSNWKDENEIYQLLCKYYKNPEEMLVPALSPGTGLPNQIIDFYSKFKEAVKRLNEEELQVPKTATHRATASSRKTKTPKSSTKSTVRNETVLPKKSRSDAEIVADVIKTMQEEDMDPLRDCINAVDNVSLELSPIHETKGILILFHGSPCEEMLCQEIAYSTGKALGLPTVNVDTCIVEALCVCDCAAKTAILNAINEFHESLRKSNPIDSEDNESALDRKRREETCMLDEAMSAMIVSEVDDTDTDNDFDFLWKKIDLLIYTKNVTTPRSKISDKKKKRSPNSSMAQFASGSYTIFQLELIQELLADFFKQPKFNKGFVVDTLTSVILKSPPLVLTTVLKCKHTIYNIHLVLCQSDFNKWAQAYEETQRESDVTEENVSKVWDKAEVDNIIETIEDMDDLEYERVNEEEKQIYITYGLESRRKKYFEKKGYNTTNPIIKEKKPQDHSKSLLIAEESENKKKIKKEEMKGKPTSEFLLMNTKYNDYVNNVYENLIQISNNWIIEECDIGHPLYNFNGQVLGSSHKKVKKKSEVQIQVSDINLSERGFPLTLITCPCLQYKNAIVNMFTRSVIVQEALKDDEPYDILKVSPCIKEYSVLLPKFLPVLKDEESLQWIFLDEDPIPKCECNPITDLHLLDDTNQDNVLNVLSKWHCTCGKKMVSSQTSTNEVPSTMETITEESQTDTMSVPLHCIKSLSDLKRRIILQPGELVRCKYAFTPQTEGHFSVKRFVEVCGWPNSRVDINVSGICTIPRLDSRPKKMFESFVRRTMGDRVYKGTFLHDQKSFEFGPIFIGLNRVYEEKYSISLKNTSLLTTDIEIQFLEDLPMFQVNKNKLLLEPGCNDVIWISAAPTEIGLHNCILLFCIRDNPEIISINIACTGVVPSVEILPLTKTIEYGKHLLYRRKDDRFIVKNDSILPIMWKVRNVQDFAIDFIIAQKAGVVQRDDNQVVPLTYIACRVGVIAHRTLIVDIYDAEGRGAPMLSDELSLSAECYDVMVECAYDNPNENFLNYGNVKVNSSVTRGMFLLNKGKYNIYYKLKKVKNFPEPSLLRSFEAFPERGVIPPTLKLVTIDFECTPTTSMNLVNVPAYTCSLLDGSKNQVVVAKFPVCISIASFYNTFTLFPLGELNFHIIPVGSGVIREVILNNTSKCPFTYDIILPQKYQQDTSGVKIKDNKIKNPSLKCGNFVIFTDDNLLAPGTSRTLKIQFLATSAETFEETINFVVSDTCPAEARGVPLKLVGTGAMPTLDFWNIETTFREHLIVKNLTAYTVPESSPHCVFVEDSVSLHFFCVTVNSSHTAAIDLYNNGMVACALNMRLHYQSNSNQEIFSLDKYQTHIEPLLHKNLGIIFRPKALEEYRAVLEIKLKLLDNQEQSFKICLIGEGTIPRVNLIYPPLARHKLAQLKFPVTCLGSISSKKVQIKNVTSVKALVVADVLYPIKEKRPIFYITRYPYAQSEDFNESMKVVLKPEEIVTLYVHFNPIKRGRTTCDVKFTIFDNPYEQFTVLCEAEAFMEDVVLIGLEMLPMDTDLEAYKNSVEGTVSSISTADSKRKSKSATFDKKKSKSLSESKKSRRTSQVSAQYSDTASPSGYSVGHSLLKYTLDLGGCELFSLKKRSILMVNNSAKLYKFKWEEVDCIVVKPAIGYISPGEEKDLEILFYSPQPIVIKKEFMFVHLAAISDEHLTLDVKGASWDSRQTITIFDHDRMDFRKVTPDSINDFRDVNLNERVEAVIDEQNNPSIEVLSDVIDMVVVYSATTEYSKYFCSLPEEMEFDDTFIYQTRNFDFKVENIGKVPLRIVWSFIFDEEFPSKLDEHNMKNTDNGVNIQQDTGNVANNLGDVASKVTLFSECSNRDSVDTWFEIDLPFKIEPKKECIKPNDTCMFRITFSPTEAFLYNVRIKTVIDNLDPYDQIISCKIRAKSLIPYVHLDIEKSDYLTSGRRKTTGITLSPHTTVLEFNVLGWGCYKKSFNIVNPTKEGYEFIFEMTMSDNPELVPVHCNMLKGYVEGGTSTEVTFTFAPTAPGVYESQWKFIIPSLSIAINLMVVGIVREPEVRFVPTILIIRNSLVGFTTKSEVILKNFENESLNFEFKGNSLCNESGKTPVIIEPEEGTLRARSETPITITYTPIQDGPLSFKIFCNIAYLIKALTLCVNALSHSIKPKVLYYLIGNQHELKSEVITDIHLDQTASTYERTIPFVIMNDGSATFFFDWRYNTSSVKKYLQMYIEPISGHVAPAARVECILYFTLQQVPVHSFPITLSISDGPQYNIYLNAKIEKPLYHFSCMDYDFGKCIVNAPDATYKKNIAFENNDTVPIILDLNFANLPELLVQRFQNTTIQPKQLLKISIYFRPKQVKEYEFQLEFWINSLCKEIVTIKGEGIPLLFDLYEGCQKSFDMGPVKLGEKIIRQIEVMNHSKISIDASFIFRDMYPTIEDTTESEGTSVCLNPSGSKLQDAGPSRGKMLQQYKDNIIQQQTAMDIQNALSSLKVVPHKCTIRPHRKVPLKIQFKPVGMIKNLNVQLNMRVLNFERPLVRLSGSATGMSLCLSQNSLQFGRVRRRGCKILKVMLLNKGDFGAEFWWQPLISNEFTISPMQGNIAAHTNVTFTVTFRPVNHNPFIKIWASCNIENYKSLEIALYAACMDIGNVQNKTLYLECPVREINTEHVIVTNPSDDMWLILSEISGGPFETLKEFNIEPNSTFEIPIHFKPKIMGKHESQVLFSPLAESALFITLVGAATHPNPNGTIFITVAAKEFHTENLLVYNITELPESYIVSTELVKIAPDKFDGYYEIKCPDIVKVWGEAAATCRWTFICYEECEMNIRVIFINEDSREYQFYNIEVKVTPSKIVDTLTFLSRARESVIKELVISNPLSTDADFYIRCDKLECPDVLRISRNSEATLSMVYSPLVVGETREHLEVSNNLVGTLLYVVILKCLPAKEKDLEFSTPLGSSIPLRLRVQNRSNVKADFKTSVSHPSIIAEREYTLGPQEKGKFQALFEPTELGVQLCKVSFNSPDAGEFIFNIKGIAVEPKPQGPFEIKAGGSITITFRNVFENTQTFKMHVDRDDFHLKTLFETVKSKKEMKVTVHLCERPPLGWSSLPTGCLTIQTHEPPEPKVQWIYFLQGKI